MWQTGPGTWGESAEVGILDDSQAMWRMVFPMSELRSIQAWGDGLGLVFFLHFVWWEVVVVYI